MTSLNQQQDTILSFVFGLDDIFFFLMKQAALPLFQNRIEQFSLSAAAPLCLLR